MFCRRVRLECTAKLCGGHSDDSRVISTMPRVTTYHRYIQTGIANIACLASNIELKDVYIDMYMSNIVSAYDSILSPLPGDSC